MYINISITLYNIIVSGNGIDRTRKNGSKLYGASVPT